MLITSYINRKQNFELLYLVLFEILISKVRNVFIESPDIYIYKQIDKTESQRLTHTHTHTYTHTHTQRHRDNDRKRDRQTDRQCVPYRELEDNSSSVLVLADVNRVCEIGEQGRAGVHVHDIHPHRHNGPSV